MINYRLATMYDVDSLVKLRLESQCDTVSCKNRHDIQLKLKDFFTRYNGIMMIAEEEGDIVATCGLQIISMMPQCNDSGYHGFVFNVYTKPEYRNKGIQSKLLSKVLDWADNKEIKEIKLETINDIAVHVYEKSGFNFDRDTMVRRRNY